MASIDDLKRRIDLHDLAEKLGLKRGKGTNQNYHAPGHADKSPSLSIFTKEGKHGWKDHSADCGGSCVDLVMHVEGCDVATAIRRLHELYGIPLDRAEAPAVRRELSRAEWIAERCMISRARAIEYLVEARKITESVARRAVEKGAVGFNEYTSPTTPAGEHGHGGPAVAFIVRTLNPGRVVAVDMRYVDPALNGGTKTQCQGDKAGHVWTSDIKRLLAAKTVYFVESSINALSVECCNIYDSAAVAVLGTGNVASIPLDWVRGKQAVICMDNDEPFPDGHKLAGTRPGLSAAWLLHERLTRLDISALLVDASGWQHNDVNDILQHEGAEALKRHLIRLEPWLIPGMAASTNGELFENAGKRRLYLPYHHDQKYWRYRVRPDFTSYVSKVDQGEDGEVKMDFSELAGFRVAAVSRLRLQGIRSTMTGDPDMQPMTKYAVSVQVTRNGADLIRRVFDDDNLHNIEKWQRFGPIWNPGQFKRMINILENAAHIGSREATNFVGLCWRNGNLAVNEGGDCYFDDPIYQCHYHNLVFPWGPTGDARKVIAAYRETYAENQALLLLVWALGAHLKAFIRFWPHAKMEADKGAGKSTLIGRLCGSIAMASLSGQTLKTEYRIVNSVAYTSHPVCWEEFSRLNDMQRKLALDLLQETYQFQETTRSQKPFLLSAPVLVAGEDAPVEDIAEKLIRLRIEKKHQGPEMPFDLPQFPVRQWLQYLADLPPAAVRDSLAACRELAMKRCSASNGQRIVENYAAFLTAWRLLADFAELPVDYGGVVQSICMEMNDYLAESKSERHPWVWVMNTVLAEIATGQFSGPHCWDEVSGGPDGTIPVLYIRTSDIMHHLSRTIALREFWNRLPIKSDRALKRQLLQAEVVHQEGVEKTINRRRVAHMLALSLPALSAFGIHATPMMEREDVS